MKKILVLCAMCSLAACGGGSGGHKGDSFHEIEVMRAGSGVGTISAEAAESNAVVTSMVSEIGVATDGSTINIGRAPFIHNGKEYQSYKLDDVDFSFADEGFGGKLKFTIDDATGEITKFTVVADEEDETDKVFERKNKTKEFAGKVNHKGWVDAVLTYDSKGKNVKLKYSDFGGFDIDVVDGWRPVFIGGYDVKKIEPNDISETAKFKGKAVGSVIAIHDGEGSGTGITLDSNAELTFDKNTGTSTLVAKFKNWYDVKYTESGDEKSIALSNYSNKDNAYRMFADTGKCVTLSNSDKAQYEYDYGDIHIDENTTVADINAAAAKEDTNLISSDIRYYGDNKIPYESVGMIQVRDCANGVCGDVVVGIDRDAEEDPLIQRQNDEVRMNMAFGVKR